MLTTRVLVNIDRNNFYIYIYLIMTCGRYYIFYKLAIIIIIVEMRKERYITFSRLIRNISPTLKTFVSISKLIRDR